MIYLAERLNYANTLLQGFGFFVRELVQAMGGHWLTLRYTRAQNGAPRPLERETLYFVLVEDTESCVNAIRIYQENMRNLRVPRSELHSIKGVLPFSRARDE